MRSTDFFLLLLLLLQTSTIQNAEGQDVGLESTLLESSIEFLCPRVGQFAVHGSCKDFYQCQRLSDVGNLSSSSIMTCPTGTIFNEAEEKCQEPHFVTGRPECVEEVGVIAPKVKEVGVIAPKVEEVGVIAPIVEEVGVIAPIFEEVGVNAPIVQDVDAIASKVEEVEVIAPKVQEVDVIAPKVKEVVVSSPKVKEEGVIALKVEEVDVIAPKDEVVVNALKVKEMVVSSPKANCTQELSEDIAEAALDTCRIMPNISDFVMFVTSRLPLRSSMEYYEEFNKIFPDFNEILATSKKNVKVWRNGNDILSDIKRVFVMARQFGREFERKYKINQERRKLQSLSGQNKSAEIMEKIQEEIKNMEEEIEDMKKLISQTSSSVIKAYFERSMKDKEIRIKEKQQQIQQTSAIDRELKEILFFLEFVRSDADDVKQRSEALEIRLEEFYNNLENDYVSLTDFSIVVNESSATLEKDRDNLKATVTKSHGETKDLETRKKELEAMLSYLNDASDAKAVELRDHIKEMERKEKTFLEESSKSCPSQNIVLSLFNFNFRGNRRLSYCEELQSKFNISQEEYMNHMEDMKAEFTRINQESNQIRSQIRAIAKYIMNPPPSGKQEDQISQLTREIKMFEELATELETLINDTDITLTLLSDLTGRIQEVIDIFSDITGNLAGMITDAKSSQNDPEKQSAKLTIDSALLTLKCQVEQFREKIPEVQKCR